MPNEGEEERSGWEGEKERYSSARDELVHTTSSEWIYLFLYQFSGASPRHSPTVTTIWLLAPF